jgi:hypothetical protein
MYVCSGPHQESPYHELHPGNEVLIGTLRFSVSDAMTISEHSVGSSSVTLSTLAEGKDGEIDDRGGDWADLKKSGSKV